MSDASALLRMLEPVVRPVPGEGGGRSAPRIPLEQRSFESLLAEIEGRALPNESGPTDEGASGASSKPARPDAGPLGPLARVDAIENASLRALVAQGRRTDATAG